MQEGIFSSEKLQKNVVEFCVVSDIHIANDEADSSRAFTKQGRNDYVFSNNRTQTPISGEAYTLKRFCEKVNWSGRLGHFTDGQHVLVLLGDIINGECGYFSSYNSIAYKMLSSSFMAWLNTGNIVYVAGNHDEEARFYSNMTNFPHKLVMDKEHPFTKCGVIFKHGHEFDCLCNGKNLLGLTGKFASSVVVKLFPPDMEDLMRGRDFYYNHSDENRMRNLRSLPEQATLQTMTGENRRIADGALKFLVDRGRDFHTIVCGHTHQSPIQINLNVDSTRKFTYINTGKFARDGYIRFRTKQLPCGTWTLSEE